MILVGALIALSRIPISLSTSPGAPSLIGALSNVALVWPLLGEFLIVTAATRAFAQRSRASAHPRATSKPDRIDLERRYGVALVAIAGVFSLALPAAALLTMLHGQSFTDVQRVIAHPLPTGGLATGFFFIWAICAAGGAALLIASEVELRRGR